MKRTIVWAALLLAVPVAPTLAQKRASSVPGFEIAEIRNTGSTNTMGYRVIVPFAGALAGTAAVSRIDGMVSTGPPDSRRLPMALVRKLAHDLRAAMPLTALPIGHGMKSVSFGTSLFIMYHGQKTPDLSFPANSKAAALKADATAIAAALNLTNSPRHPGR